MKSGYKVFWTDHAIYELEETVAYLETNFTKKELQRLAQKIESTIYLISQNPRLFSQSDHLGIFKVTILKYNTLYYRIKDDSVEILSFFSNRQLPQKRKL